MEVLIFGILRYIDSGFISLRQPPLYNDHFVCRRGNRCGEVKL